MDCHSDCPTRRTTHGKLAGRLFVVAAALMWSSSGLFVKAPIFADWSETDRGPLLAFWRALFAAIILLPTIRRPRWRRELVPLTLSFATMNLTFLTAMTLTTAANTTWLQATAPWWVFLIGLFIFRQGPARGDLVPLAFGCLGVGLILCFELTRGEMTSTTGVTFGVVSGISYAGVIVCMRQLRAENPAWLVAISHLVAAVALLPWVIQLGVRPTPGQFLVLAGFATFQMVIPYLLMIRGLRAISSQEAVGIGLIEPVVLPVWVFLVWGEMPAWWTVAGASLILAGLILRYLVLDTLRPRGPKVPGTGG